MANSKDVTLNFEEIEEGVSPEFFKEKTQEEPKAKPKPTGDEKIIDTEVKATRSNEVYKVKFLSVNLTRGEASKIAEFENIYSKCYQNAKDPKADIRLLNEYQSYNPQNGDCILTIKYAVVDTDKEKDIKDRLKKSKEESSVPFERKIPNVMGE